MRKKIILNVPDLILSSLMMSTALPRSRVSCLMRKNEFNGLATNLVALSSAALLNFFHSFIILFFCLVLWWILFVNFFSCFKNHYLIYRTYGFTSSYFSSLSRNFSTRRVTLNDVSMSSFSFSLDVKKWYEWLWPTKNSSTTISKNFWNFISLLLRSFLSNFSKNNLD